MRGPSPPTVLKPIVLGTGTTGRRTEPLTEGFSNVVTVGMYYDVLPGQGPAFVAKFREVIDAMNRAVPGHKATYLYQRVDDPESFAILSEWEDQASFLAFIRSDEFRRVTAWGREGILRNPPQHKIYPRSEDLGRPPQTS
jgi:heme-degrading monooxygenase HmoA